MDHFDDIFPTFLAKCGELHELLRMVAFVLFVAGVMVFVVQGFTRRLLFRYLIRLTVLTSLLVFLPVWGNTLQSLLQETILSGLEVDPTAVQEQYVKLLDSKPPPDTDNSWWDLAQGLTASIIEGLLGCVGLVAAYLLFLAYVFQKIILHLGYALSPLLIGFMAIHGLRAIGNRYLLHLVGVLLWPLGWAVAAIVTQGLLDFMTDPDSKFLDPTGGMFYLQNVVGIALVGFWIVFSTFAAPLLIQRVIVAGALMGADLMHAAASTLVAGTVAGAQGLAAGLAAGVARPAAVAAGATTALLSTISAASGTGQAGAFILAGAVGRSTPDNSAPPPKFADSDRTGDRAARQLLADSRASSN